MTSSAAETLKVGLPFGFGAFVVAVVLLHLALPSEWIWHIGFLALTGMLFTYPVHAVVEGRDQLLEVGLSGAFVLVGLVGLLTNPLLLIGAIAGHGLLDFAKARGLGATVPLWYLVGCGVFDLAYAAFLLSYG